MTAPTLCISIPLVLSHQILRWNWSRVVLALSFARSTALMAFALRFSVLPIIDPIMRLAFDKGVESPRVGDIEPEYEVEIERSAINLTRFTASKYFESELRPLAKSKTFAHKTAES